MICQKLCKTILFFQTQKMFGVRAKYKNNNNDEQFIIDDI